MFLEGSAFSNTSLSRHGMIKLTDGSVSESRIASKDENSSVPDNDTNRKKSSFFQVKSVSWLSTVKTAAVILHYSPLLD